MYIYGHVLYQVFFFFIRKCFTSLTASSLSSVTFHFYSISFLLLYPPLEFTQEFSYCYCYFHREELKKKKKEKFLLFFFLLMESSFIALLLFDRLRLHKSCSNRTFSCQLFFLCAFLIPFHVGWLSWDTVPTQWRGFVVPLWQLYSHPAIHGSQQPSAHRGLVTVSAWCATIATMCRDLIKVKTRRTVISALAAYSAQLNIGKRKRKRN